MKHVFNFNCLEIKNVNKSKINSFILLNDIREIKSSKHKLGFFHNNILIMICTFDIKNENLFIRNLCKLINHKILNLHSLFEYLKHTYDIKNIYLIDDMRYNYYKNINNECSYIKPTYWYYNKNKKKTELHNKNIVNYINNLYEKSYIKVWDCGYIKIKI